MYQLPLRYVKLSDDVAVCATRIIAMMSTDAHQARETIKQERKSGHLINASGREETKTAVFLDNGTVVASPKTVNVLLNAIEKSNAKQFKRANETRRIKVYDVVDEEPDEELDEDMSELSTDLDGEE